MALKTFVKVSGVNNLSDARYCAGMLVDQLGFNVEAVHDNYTDPKAFKEISDWLSGVDFVAEVEDETTNLSTIKEAYNVQVIQIESIDQIEVASELGLDVIYKTKDLDEAVNIWNSFGDKLSYILLETQSEVSSIQSQVFPLVIQGSFSVSIIDTLLENIQPHGIALVGGDEIRPGYKDFDALADILEALEIDDLA